MIVQSCFDMPFVLSSDAICVFLQCYINDIGSEVTANRIEEEC